MKTTGIIRKIDELGRIVIPKEMRSVYDIKEGDPMEIFVDGDAIALKKYDGMTPHIDLLNRLKQNISQDAGMGSRRKDLLRKIEELEAAMNRKTI